VVRDLEERHDAGPPLQCKINVRPIIKIGTDGCYMPEPVHIAIAAPLPANPPVHCATWSKEAHRSALGRSGIHRGSWCRAQLNRRPVAQPLPILPNAV
jgi:hypothetical protein